MAYTLATMVRSAGTGLLCGMHCQRSAGYWRHAAQPTTSQHAAASGRLVRWAQPACAQPMHVRTRTWRRMQVDRSLRYNENWKWFEEHHKLDGNYFGHAFMDQARAWWPARVAYWASAPPALLGCRAHTAGPQRLSIAGPGVCNTHVWH